MRILSKLALAFFLCGIGSASAQMGPVSFPAGHSATEVVDFLLDVGTQVHWTEMDCTHFVHYLYEMAGLPYTYADSKTLYHGAEGFKRVSEPQPGDVIVWQGHAGIVVDSEQHTFLSVLRTGVKSAAYDSHYWQHRGQPRFFRYVALASQLPSIPQTATLQEPKRIIVPQESTTVGAEVTPQHVVPGQAAIMGWITPSKPGRAQTMVGEGNTSRPISSKTAVTKQTATQRAIVVGTFNGATPGTGVSASEDGAE